MKKAWYHSRTVGLTLLGLVALGVQVAIGEQWIPLEYQGYALVIAALVLRFVTSESIALPKLTDVTDLLRAARRVLGTWLFKSNGL